MRREEIVGRREEIVGRRELEEGGGRTIEAWKEGKRKRKGVNTSSQYFVINFEICHVRYTKHTFWLANSNLPITITPCQSSMTNKFPYSCNEEGGGGKREEGNTYNN